MTGLRNIACSLTQEAILNFTERMKYKGFILTLYILAKTPNYSIRRKSLGMNLEEFDSSIAAFERVKEILISEDLISVKKDVKITEIQLTQDGICVSLSLLEAATFLDDGDRRR